MEEEEDLDGSTLKAKRARRKGQLSQLQRLEPAAHASDTPLADEESELDTTAYQYRSGKDLQGIPWERMQLTRAEYREKRLTDYDNYVNLREVVDAGQEELNREAKAVTYDGHFYSLCQNLRQVKAQFVHFQIKSQERIVQLRNLLWATSKHDYWLMHQNCIYHHSNLTRRHTTVLDVPELPQKHGIPTFTVSTTCVGHGLLAAGGFNGELVVKRIHEHGVAHSEMMTRPEQIESGITNGLEIFEGASGSVSIMASNNDNVVRTFDATTFKLTRRFDAPWPVNWSTVAPNGGKEVAVVGDDPVGYLIDGDNSEIIAELQGHLDFSFAAAWHPDGNMLATGNQDMTTRIWDRRKLSKAVAVLRGKLGAIRSLRFSSDGRFLAAAECADFVNIYDVKSGYERGQQIDFFGEIAGIAFTPEADYLLVSVVDNMYGSLMQFCLMGAL